MKTPISIFTLPLFLYLQMPGQRCAPQPVVRHGLPVCLGDAPERQRQQSVPQPDRAQPGPSLPAPTKTPCNNHPESNSCAAITQ